VTSMPNTPYGGQSQLVIEVEPYIK